MELKAYHTTQYKSNSPQAELRQTAFALRAVRELFEGKQWEQALKGIKR